jgi:hypothetical protein
MFNQQVRRVIALLIVVGLPASLMVWYRAHQSTGFASIELIVYPLVFGSLGIAVIWLLKRFYLGESLYSLNSGEGSLVGDIFWGIALTMVYFVLFFAARYTLSDLLAFTPNRELLGLMLDMRERPWMVVLWFGPVLWIGISLYEELVRTFLLSELWSFSENKLWISTVVLFAAVVVGTTHWSQGPYGIVTIAIKSIVIGAFYFHRRRLLPLVIAHVLYDGLQVGTLLLTYPR